MDKGKPSRVIASFNVVPASPDIRPATSMTVSPWTSRPSTVSIKSPDSRPATSAGPSAENGDDLERAPRLDSDTWRSRRGQGADHHVQARDDPVLSHRAAELGWDVHRVGIDRVVEHAGNCRFHHRQERHQVGLHSLLDGFTKGHKFGSRHRARDAAGKVLGFGRLHNFEHRRSPPPPAKHRRAAGRDWNRAGRPPHITGRMSPAVPNIRTSSLPGLRPRVSRLSRRALPRPSGAPGGTAILIRTR